MKVVQLTALLKQTKEMGWVPLLCSCNIKERLEMQEAGATKRKG